jgi:hypothetical protein
MRKFVLSTLAMVTLAALSVSAQADMAPGPIKNGNQCFNSAPGFNKDAIGYWAACPQQASTASATTTRQARRRHAAR